MFGQNADGRRLKWLPGTDEFRLQNLAFQIERQMKTGEVIRVLAGLVSERGEAEFILRDSGPEFVARAVQEWIVERGLKTLYIASGNPWENAYSETFNSRFRDEFLNRERFASLLEAKVLGEEYRWDYNEERPVSSLDYRRQTSAPSAA